MSESGPESASAGAPVGRVEVADLIVAYLEQIGVEYVFGVPGGAIEPLYNALARSARRGGVRAVVARHEAGAAFMADGYARESGKIGVCCATSGPGATNLITGVACAYENNVPLLVLTGQPSLPNQGRGALQDSSASGVDIAAMLRHCTRYSTVVSHVAQVETQIINALMSSMQDPRGPVHLAIPVDIQRQPLFSVWPRVDLKARLQQAAAVEMRDEAALRQMCAEIKRGRRVAILLGAGAAEAMDSILTLADALNAVIVTTPDGKGLINPQHPLYRGVFGFAGHDSAAAALRQEDVDLVLAVGTPLGEWTSGGWCDSVLNEYLVHIDSSELHLMRSPMARLHVRGRIKTLFEYALSLLRATQTPPVPAPALPPQDPYWRAGPNDDAVIPIRPQRLMAELGRRCPYNTRFLADAGNSMAWAVHCLELHDRRMYRSLLHHDPRPVQDRRVHAAGWLRITADFAPMGWAIGGAVGTALANPHCPVVCLTGDGSFLMNGQEITVAQSLGLTVLFVILNDAALGMVKHGQRLAGAEPIGFELPAVDYARMVAAMGIPGHVVHSGADLAALDWAQMLHRPGPTLLDVRIDPEAVPPMNLRIQSLGNLQ